MKTLSHNLAKPVAIATLALSIIAAPIVHADAGAAAPYPEQTRGLVWGGVVGALVAGPLGAIVGGSAGSFAGYQQGTEHDLAGTRDQLHQQQLALEQTQQQLQQAQTDKAELEQSLALAAAQVQPAAGPMTLDHNEDLGTALLSLAEGFSVTYAFRTGSDRLEPRETAQLTNLAQALGSHPQLLVEVDGYADVRGSDTVNVDLSRRRAQTVAQLLEKAGVGADRITVNANGEQRHVADAADREGLFFDRRVVLSFHGAQK